MSGADTSPSLAEGFANVPIPPDGIAFYSKDSILSHMHSKNPERWIQRLAKLLVRRRIPLQRAQHPWPTIVSALLEMSHDRRPVRVTANPDIAGWLTSWPA